MCEVIVVKGEGFKVHIKNLRIRELILLEHG